MDVLVTQFVVYLLVFVRVMSLIIAAPVLGHQAIPVQVKIAVGLFLSFVLFPVVSASTGVVDQSLAGLTVNVGKEFVIGLIIGFAVGLIFSGIQFAGELISFDMGITMASVLDPESNVQTPVLGEFLNLFATMIFLALDGHHFVLQAIQLSYRAAPIGGFVLKQPLLQKMIELTGFVFVIAVKFAAPLMVALFLTNVALAILARVMPQMNIFAISFSAKIAVGLLMLMSIAPLLAYVFTKLLTAFENTISELVQVL